MSALVIAKGIFLGWLGIALAPVAALLLGAVVIGCWLGVVALVDAIRSRLR